MADEYKEITENTGNGGSKKKKIIITVVAVVVVCVIVAVVCALNFAGGGKEKYTDTPVSTEPTSELKPGVENGVFVDSAPTAQSGSSSGSSQDQQSSGSGSGSGSSSGAQNGGSGSSGNSGGNSGGNSENSGNSGGSGSGNEDNVARQLEIYVTLPNDGSVSDKLFIYVNDKLETPDGVDCKLDGQTYYCLTAESYTGVVTVEARLENYGTSARQISTQNGSQVSFALPLDGSEENFAPNI